MLELEDDIPDMLVRVKAPHFCAFLVVRGWVCREAAPILRWALNKRWSYLSSYFQRKGYEVIRMPDQAPPRQ